MNSGLEFKSWVRRRGFLVFVLGITIAGLALRTSSAWLSLRVLQPTSDESLFALMAQDIRAGARPLLFYAQPYMFPLESYLAAPIANLLPPTAAGARLPLLALNWVGLGLAVCLAWRLFEDRISRGVALVLFMVPSPYVLMIQSLFSPPGYAALLVLGLGVALAAAIAHSGCRPGFNSFLVGLISGVGFGMHQLIAVFAVPAFFLLAFSGPRFARGKWIVWALIGILSGLIPYLWAKWTIPGAFAAVEGRRALGDVLKRLWEPALSHSLATALGFRCSPFPDEPPLPDPPKFWGLVGGGVVALLILVVIFRRLIEVIRARFRSDALISPRDLPWMVIVLNLLAFASSPRASADSFRYLLPAAISFPYLLADLCSRQRWLRVLAVSLTLVLLIVNSAGAARLHRLWREPNFAHDRASIPDLDPALDALHSLGITRAIASYGAAYRIYWQSGRTIVCAQPQNERFPHWPIPYTDLVWDGKPLAYVLTERIRFLKPSVFERHLKTQGVQARMIPAGNFRIYMDFSAPEWLSAAEQVPSRRIRVRASENSDLAQYLLDGDITTAWTSDGRMDGSEWIELQWDEPLSLSHLKLIQGRQVHDTPETYRIRIVGSSEREIDVPCTFDKFDLDRGRPRYGRTVQTIPLEGHEGTSLRVEIARPRRNRTWTVAEIEVYVRPLAGTENTVREETR